VIWTEAYIIWSYKATQQFVLWVIFILNKVKKRERGESVIIINHIQMPRINPLLAFVYREIQSAPGFALYLKDSPRLPLYNNDVLKTETVFPLRFFVKI